MMLRFTADQAKTLADLAEAAYPREACALLVGRRTDHVIAVTEIVPADNLATTPEREFELDPAVHIAVLRRLRDQIGPDQFSVIGHWHSHPNGRAAPSAQDATMIYDRHLVWLISAVQDGRAGAPQAFQPDDAGTGFRPLSTEITVQDV